MCVRASDDEADHSSFSTTTTTTIIITTTHSLTHARVVLLNASSSWLRNRWQESAGTSTEKKKERAAQTYVHVYHQLLVPSRSLVFVRVDSQTHSLARLLPPFRPWHSNRHTHTHITGDLPSSRLLYTSQSPKKKKKKARETQPSLLD